MCLLTGDPAVQSPSRLHVFERLRAKRRQHSSSSDDPVTLLHRLRPHRHSRRRAPRALAPLDRARAQPAQGGLGDHACITRQLPFPRGHVGEERCRRGVVRLPRWGLFGEIPGLSPSIDGDGARVTRSQPAGEAQAGL